MKNEPRAESGKSRLESQLLFLAESDRLKSVLRQSTLLDRSRRENSAEHSWHLALFALVLSEYAAGSIRLERVVMMLLLHDLVEIDAGDHPIHGPSAGAGQSESESQAASRLFGLLLGGQGPELKALWREFEDAETDDAKFAKALDRVQPLLVNVLTGGGTWNKNNVSREDVFARYGPVISRGAPALWEVCEKMVDSHFR